MDKKSIGNAIEYSDLELIVKMLKDNDLGKIEIKNGDFELCIEDKKCPPMPPVMPTMTSINAQAPVVSTTTNETQVSGKVVKSPIVGTFYSSSSPDSDPFVTVGKKVKKGDVIFIIESMKVMSEINCEYDGVVKEILVSDGEAVEFDQPIMIIE